MASRKKYTRKDNGGFVVSEGDMVTVAFEGVVRSIDSNGRMVIKTAQGFFTQYDPDYQGLLKHQPTANAKETANANNPTK